MEDECYILTWIGQLFGLRLLVPLHQPQVMSPANQNHKAIIFKALLAACPRCIALHLQATPPPKQLRGSPNKGSLPNYFPYSFSQLHHPTLCMKQPDSAVVVNGSLEPSPQITFDPLQAGWRTAVTSPWICLCPAVPAPQPPAHPFGPGDTNVGQRGKKHL